MLNLLEVEISPTERTIVENCLKLFHDACLETVNFDELMDNVELPHFKGRDPNQLAGILGTMLNAHKDMENLYYLTDYHFLILHRALKYGMDKHNEAVLQGLPGVVIATSRAFSVREFTELLFFDEHFLLTQLQYSALSDKEKVALGFTEELFGVVYGMPPHPTEVEMAMEPYKGTRRSGNAI